MARMGGPNEALYVDLITAERFPAAVGYARHAGQPPGGVGLDDPYAASPPSPRPHTHKSTEYGVVFVGAGQPCEHCQAQLEGRWA